MTPLTNNPFAPPSLAEADDPSVQLRPATSEDAHLLWEWRNDPEVRAASFSTYPVEWEEHQAWLVQKIEDPSCAIFIGEVDGEPVGVIRFDIVGAEAEVSVSVSQRGRGYGSQIIEAGANEMKGLTLVANVRPTNVASQRAFVKAGFVPVRLERHWVKSMGPGAID